MALSFDAGASATSGGAATSLTYSHTCATGASIFVEALCDVTRTVTGVTYGGDALTQIGTPVADGGGFEISLWYKAVPLDGANNVIITVDASSNPIFGRSASFLGADTANLIGATGSGTTSATTSHVYSLTTSYANSWLVTGARGQNQVLTASTGATRRSPTGANSDTAIFSSSSPLSAGSNSMTVTTPVNDTTAYIIAELRAEATPNNSGFFRAALM